MAHVEERMIGGSLVPVSVMDSSAQAIDDMVQKGHQLTPEFANSVAELEERGDTNKLYVLPDGYIYAYMTKYGAQHTDLIPTAIDVDGTPYNGGLGFKKGWRFGAGAAVGDVFGETGVANDRPNGVITGMIPYNPSKVKKIRVCGFTEDLIADDYMIFFDADYKHIDQQGRIKYYVETYGQTFAEESAFDNKAKTFVFDIDTFTEKSSYYGSVIKEKAAYVAFSVMAANIQALTVTFDEEISFTASTAWQSTGHQFVPADHEDRIIPLEKTAENHEGRIRTLELYGADSTSAEDIPAYIKAEADGVIARVMEKQGDRCFTMIGISDPHYGGMGDNKDNLIRSCKAISYIQGRIQVDAVASLGDNIPHGTSTEDTLKSGHRWLKEVNEVLKMTEGEGIAMFRTPGNHDRMGGHDESGNPTEPISDNDIYRYIGGYNRGCVADVPGGWGYQDFESYKLRVILLNTAETEGKGRFSDFSGYHMSSKQYNWLIETLDMSDKADARDWQILVLSHHRPDDYQIGVVGNEWGADRFVLPNILHAYRTGGSYTATLIEDGTVVSCDFAEKNQAGLIGSIHGHHHAYIYGNLCLGNAVGDTETDIVAISTPTSSFGSGEGHNDDNSGTWYDSVKDTAEETAFCVYSIDLDNHVIQAIHYGNGIDREISYTIPTDRAENVEPSTEVSWNDLTDKPFGGKVILPGTTFVFDAKTAGAGIELENPIVVDTDKTYRIICNGVEYTSTVYYDEGMLEKYIGLPGYTEPGECPIRILCFEGYENVIRLNNETAGTYTVGVYEGDGCAIDDDYIPPTIARVADITSEKIIPATIARVADIASGEIIPDTIARVADIASGEIIPGTIARVADITWENIPDKPFYNEQTVIYEETTIPSEVDEVELPGFPIIDLDETYFVVVDGVEYEGKFIYNEQMDETIWRNENCPVYILQNGIDSGNWATYALVSSSGTYTFSVRKAGGVKTIDEACLPYITEEWTFELADGSTVTKRVVLK